MDLKKVLKIYFVFKIGFIYDLFFREKYFPSRGHVGLDFKMTKSRHTKRSAEFGSFWNKKMLKYIKKIIFIIVQHYIRVLTMRLLIQNYFFNC